MTESVISRNGVAAAPHRLAAETGRLILADGGNAWEAMVAMAATIAVVYPHMSGIGGDAFWIVREPSGRVRYIEACGPAGAHATIGRYRETGLEAVPPRGSFAALTVPGAVGGWMRALEAAKGAGGRIPLDVLLADAVRFARDGYPVARSQATVVPKAFDELKAAPGFADRFMADGRLLAEGVTLALPALAATLEQLARAGLQDFYRGDVGREVAADLERIGSPVARADLERYEARFAGPLTAELSSATVYNSPPPTQGLATLLILGIAERLRLGYAESVDFHHGLIEAVKRALRIRDRVVTDPDRLDSDPQALLTPATFEREAAKIDMGRAAPWPAAGYADGDTVWMGVIDKEGRAVSYIQSVFWEWGSGCVLPATGVLMQNRGTSFSLDPKARNPLEPGLKPFHTLNPPLAAMKDGRIVAFGAMGGEGQPQSQAQIFLRHIGYGLPMAEAVDLPRWRLGKSWGAEETTLKLENRFPERILDGLASLGHAVEVIRSAYSHDMGHSGFVVRHPDGRIEGVHDPRSDGGAVGV